MREYDYKFKSKLGGVLLEAIKEELAIRKEATFHVNGSCMAPGIKSKSKIKISKSHWNLCGDIMAYNCNHTNQRYVHRFLGKVPARGGLKYLLMADNDSIPDTLVEKNQVLGTVISVNGKQINIPLSQRLRSIKRYVSAIVHVLSKKAV